METKSVFASATVWVNVLTLVAAFGAEVAGELPPEAAKYVLMGVAFANIILRVFKTTQPVHISK